MISLRDEYTKEKNSKIRRKVAWKTTLWGAKESNGNNDILGGAGEIKEGGIQKQRT